MRPNKIVIPKNIKYKHYLTVLKATKGNIGEAARLCHVDKKTIQNAIAWDSQGRPPDTKTGPKPKLTDPIKTIIFTQTIIMPTISAYNLSLFIRQMIGFRVCKTQLMNIDQNLVSNMVQETPLCHWHLNTNKKGSNFVTISFKITFWGEISSSATKSGFTWIRLNHMFGV